MSLLHTARKLIGLKNGILRLSIPGANRLMETSSYVPELCPIEKEPYCRQRQEIILGNRVPLLAPDAFVAPNAVIVGDVDIYDKVSIWHGCVLRGDLNSIKIFGFSNVQDRTVIHAARSSPTGLPASTVIGQHVSIGPDCVLRSCKIENEVIIGSKCVIMEGSVISTQSRLLPGTVVPPGKFIPTGEVWSGNPARFLRKCTKDEVLDIIPIAEKNYSLKDRHILEYSPYGTAWRQAQKAREAVGMM